MGDGSPHVLCRLATSEALRTQTQCCRTGGREAAPHAP